MEGGIVVPLMLKTRGADAARVAIFAVAAMHILREGSCHTEFPYA